MDAVHRIARLPTARRTVFAVPAPRPRRQHEDAPRGGGSPRAPSARSAVGHVASDSANGPASLSIRSARPPPDRALPTTHLLLSRRALGVPYISLLPHVRARRGGARLPEIVRYLPAARQVTSHEPRRRTDRSQVHPLPGGRRASLFHRARRDSSGDATSRRPRARTWRRSHPRTSVPLRRGTRPRRRRRRSLLATSAKAACWWPTSRVRWRWHCCPPRRRGQGSRWPWACLPCPSPRAAC